MSKKNAITLNNSLISVIIPVYNAEKYIARSIDSVKNQTYSNLEIIIIDDGSNDKTGIIVDKYLGNNSRIRVYHVKNGGEAKSRNLGLKYAQGDYIAFCYAGDYMYPKMLEKMINAICQDGSDLAICAWRNVDEKGNELPWKKSKLQTRVVSGYLAQKKFLLTGNIEGFCWNKLFPKNYMTKMIFNMILDYCPIVI